MIAMYIEKVPNRNSPPRCPLVTSFLTFQTFVAQGFQDSVNNL